MYLSGFDLLFIISVHTCWTDTEICRIYKKKFETISRKTWASLSVMTSRWKMTNQSMSQSVIPAAADVLVSTAECFCRSLSVSHADCLSQYSLHQQFNEMINQSLSTGHWWRRAEGRRRGCSDEWEDTKHRVIGQTKKLYAEEVEQPDRLRVIKETYLCPAEYPRSYSDKKRTVLRRESFQYHLLRAFTQNSLD